MNRWPGKLVFLGLAMFLSACNLSLAADITPPPGYPALPPATLEPEVTSGPVFPLVAPKPAAGAAIYAEECAPCHGTTGRGDGPRSGQLPNPPPALGSVEVARQASPAAWFRIVTQGNLERFMPPFGSLTQGERWDVVAYMFSLSASADSASLGKEIFQANCASCHGVDGKGANAPDLTSQERMAAKSAADLFQVVTSGAAPAMPAYGDTLSEDERWALVDYLRWLTFDMGSVHVAASSATDMAQAPEVVSPTLNLSMTLPVIASGVVTGKVSSSSVNSSLAGLEVMLHAFDEMQVILTATTTTDDEGSFVFNDMEMAAGRFFLATVKYQEITYGSEVVTVESGVQSLDLPIEVYASTRDASGLVVDRLHFFFEMLTPDTVRVVELYVISNPTDKTLISAGEGQPVVSFTLPSGAGNLEFQDGVLGERYLLTETGFADTLPVRPGMGSYQVLFSYEMPFNRKLDLSRPAAMKTDAVVILVPEDGLSITGSGVQDAGVRDMQGTPYRMYNGPSLSAGQELKLTVGSSFKLTPSGDTTGLLIGVGAFGLVMVGAGLWLYRRSQALDAPDTFDSGVQAGASAETVMDAILTLDDLYQAGQIPEDAYRQRRAELKAQLKDVMGKA